MSQHKSIEEYWLEERAKLMILEQALLFTNTFDPPWPPQSHLKNEILLNGSIGSFFDLQIITTPYGEAT